MQIAQHQLQQQQEQLAATKQEGDKLLKEKVGVLEAQLAATKQEGDKLLKGEQLQVAELQDKLQQQQQLHEEHQQLLRASR